MGLFFVLVALCAFVGTCFSIEIKAQSTDIAPVVITIYSGPFAPTGIWSDADGNIYGCETAFHSLFKITSSGLKTDFAGTHGLSGSATEGDSALAALFNSPRAVWADDEFLYVTDSANNRIRRISWTTSLVSTIVGGGASSIPLAGAVQGTSVALTLPNAIAGASNGKIYFADFDHVYVLTTSSGLVGMVGFIAGGGDHIGTFAHGAQASLSDIQGLAVDPTSNNNILFVADSGNKVVRKMDLATGKSIIFAGRVHKENYRLPSKLYENGEAAFEVTFGNPSSVWVDGNGHVFIYDSLYHIISVVRHDKVFLFAGQWSYAEPSSRLMRGLATHVQIQPNHIFGDSSRGVLYLSDGTRGGIQQISPLNVNLYGAPVIPTITSLTNLDAVLSFPKCMWTDAAGNMFVTDSSHRVLVQSITDGTVTTFAGIVNEHGPAEDGDGLAANTAKLNNPFGIWGDSENLYICDTNNGVIRAVNWATNLITTVAGGGNDTVTSATAIPAISAKLFRPTNLWGDGAGNIYFTSTSKIYLFTPLTGMVVHFAYGGNDEGKNTAGTNGPEVPFLDLKLASISSGELIISGDPSEHCLYVVEPAPGVLRKLDLVTKKATILAGIHSEHAASITSGAIATTQKFLDLIGLFASADGLIFLSDYLAVVVHVVDPVTGKIYHVAGTFGDQGPSGLRASNDATNLFGIGGDPTAAKLAPLVLWGDNQLDRLYVVEPSHSAIRIVQPLALPPLASSGRRRRLEKIHFPGQNSRLRGSIEQF
jgi:sugar lactone lactonase YvrE